MHNSNLFIKITCCFRLKVFLFSLAVFLIESFRRREYDLDVLNLFVCRGILFRYRLSLLSEKSLRDDLVLVEINCFVGCQECNFP